MKVSRIFENAFGILKANPKIILPFFILMLLIGVLSVYLSFSLSNAATSAGINTVHAFFSMVLTNPGAVLLLMLIIIIGVFVSPLPVTMYISIADQSYEKATVSLARAFAVAKKNYSNMLFLSVFIMIFWMGVLALLAAVFALPAVITGAGVGTVLWILIGVVVSLVVLVVLTLCFYEASTVLILEKLAPVDAVSRSFQIGTKRLKLLFKILLFTILVTVVFIVLDVVVVYAVHAIVGLSGHKQLGLWVAELVNFLLVSAFDSSIMMVPVVFYKEYVEKRAQGKKR